MLRDRRPALGELRRERLDRRGASPEPIEEGAARGILEVEPEKRLAMTWSAHWSDSVTNDPPSRVTYELSPAGASQTKLRVIHDGFDAPTATYTESAAGWPLMLSSLKSLLETGKPLEMQ